MSLPKIWESFCSQVSHNNVIPYKVCEHTGFEMVMNTALPGTMVMRVQRVLRWCSADTILRLDVQPIRFSDFGEIWFPRVHCSGVVRMRRALRRNLRWNRDFKVFVANLLTQPESTGRPIIIIIIIILVIITCQSRHKVPSLVIFLQHAQCFIPVEIVGRFPNWHESVQWVPSKSIWVEDFFNRVISSQEGFTLQICLCWCKGSFQKRFSGIRPLRGGRGYPPFPLRKKTFFFSHRFSVKGVRGGGTPLTDKIR